MLRPILLFSALAAAAPASAATYSATLTAPATERFVARDIVWACAGDGCRGTTEASRPAVLCQSLARHSGRVDRFLVDGRAFTSDELGRCNTAAKAQAGQALAAH